MQSQKSRSRASFKICSVNTSKEEIVYLDELTTEKKESGKDLEMTISESNSNSGSSNGSRGQDISHFEVKNSDKKSMYPFFNFFIF